LLYQLSYFGKHLKINCLRVIELQTF